MQRPAVLAVAAMVALAIVALGACGKDEQRIGLGRRTAPGSTTATDTTTAPAIPQRSTKDGCRAVAAPTPRAGTAQQSRRKLAPGRRYVATVRTNCGTFQIKLNVGSFPKTARSFAGLVRSGYYDGLSFHRIAKPGGNDFVIQGGDPRGSGDGGPGFTVVEKPPRGTTYPRLTVAMAKANDERPGTSGSQFFIVTGDGTGLQPLYALIGRVIHGGKAIRRIAAVPADPVTEAPLDPVVIDKVTIQESGH